MHELLSRRLHISQQPLLLQNSEDSLLDYRSRSDAIALYDEHRISGSKRYHITMSRHELGGAHRRGSLRELIVSDAGKQGPPPELKGTGSDIMLH